MGRLKSLVNTNKSMIAIASLLVLFAGAGIVFSSSSASAACPSLSTTNGAVNTTVSVATSGNYRVWSRVLASNGNTNAYYLEVGDTNCGIVVGDSPSMPFGSYTWVDYKEGNTASKITLNLTAGTHQVRLVGKEAGIKLDKVLFLADLNCNPNNTDCEAAAADTAPASPSGLSANPGDGSAVLSWTANSETDLSHYTVEYKKASDSSWTASSNVVKPSTGKTMSGLTNGVQYNFRISAVDAAGNASGFTSTNATPVAPPDTTKPTVSISTPANNATVKGVVAITATANDNAGVSKVEFRINGILAGTDSTSPYSYSWLTSSVADDQNYALSARAFDNAGNQTDSGVVTVKVDNVDNVAPVTTISAPADSNALSGTVSIAATATDNVDVTSMRVLVDGILKATSTTGSITYNWVTSESDNGTHIVRVESLDAVGNIGAATREILVQNADQTAPAVPTGLQVSAGDGQVSMTWTANTEADLSHYAVKYKKVSDPDLGSSWTWPATQLTTNSYTITGLTNGIEYNVEVRAIDTSINKSNYASAKATPKAIDTTPPVAPATLAATVVSSSQINLSWAPSSSQDLASYNIYRDGTIYQSGVVGSSFGDTGLAEKTTYTYEVSSVDASGNESARSNPASGTTPTTATHGNVTGAIKSSGSSAPLRAYVSIYVNGNKQSQYSSRDSGQYAFSSILAGTYNITANKRGYLGQTKSVIIRAGETTNQDFVLEGK
jgi:chitinase